MADGETSQGRRPWVRVGLILTIALLLAVPHAQDVATLLALLLAWQLALNMIPGPLSAWAGDAVPDAQKGLLGGLIALSPALVAAAPAGKVATIRIPLRRFADAGADLAQVDAPVTIAGDKGLAVTLVNTNVEAVGENLACPPAAK